MSGSIDQFKLKPLTLAIRKETQHKGGFLGKIFKVVVPIAIPFIAPALFPAMGIFGKLALNMGMGALTSKITGGNPLTGALLSGAGTLVSQSGILKGGLKNVPGGAGGTPNLSTAANVANPSGFAFMGGAGQTGAALANSAIPNVTTALDAAGNVIGTTGFNPTAINAAGQTLSNVPNAGNLLPTSAGIRGIDSPQFFNQGVSPVPQVNPNNLGLNTVSPDITNTLLSTDPNQGIVPTPTDVRNVQAFTSNAPNNVGVDLTSAPSDAGFVDQVNQQRNVNVGPDGRTISGTQSTPATHGTDFFSRIKQKARKIFGKAADNLIENPNRLMSVLTGLASDNLTDLTDEEKQMIADQKRRLAELEKSDKVACAQHKAIFNDLLSEVRSFDPDTIARKSATQEAIKLDKLKRDTLRSTNPRRDKEAEFIARQFDIQTGRDSSLAFRDALDTAQQNKRTGLFKLTQMIPQLDARGFDAGDKVAKLEDTAEKNRIARAKTTAEFGGALFDFDDPLKKKEEEDETRRTS